MADIRPFPSMTVTQKFRTTPQFTNKRKQPAAVDGIPTWASSNEAVAMVVPDANGLSAVIVAQGVGDYDISVAADADMGAGIRVITGARSGSITQGEAETISDFTDGIVEEQDGTEIQPTTPPVPTQPPTP